MGEPQEKLIEAARDAAERGANSVGDPGKVGAAVRASDGGIYTGSVVSTEDRHQTIHAERLAVTNAVTEHEEPNPIEAVAVNTALAVDEESSHARVCGSCLHFISEFSNGDIPIYIVHMLGERETTLRTLYPEPWSKSSDSAEYP
ncbi:cytidine deaminase family protein [Halorhabdus rudnickae]|uniref:cytidine deaminase family protein n=1 Tax=Halorhabdus rudnickae TaxID=1775544 RepID=UPI0010838964